MKGPGFSRLNRLLGLGIIFSSGGWFFLLATAFATSSAIVDVFQEASLSSVAGRVSVILGGLLGTVAVTFARRNYVFLVMGPTLIFVLRCGWIRSSRHLAGGKTGPKLK